MSRVTVEDCILSVPNRFELVLMAAKRARDIEKGASPLVAKDSDKSTVIALREIAEEAISIEGLKTLAKDNILERNNLVVNEAEEEKYFDLKKLVDENEDDDELLDAEDLTSIVEDLLGAEDLEALKSIDEALAEEAEAEENDNDNENENEDSPELDK